jgi:two-component system, response regulator RegA
LAASVAEAVEALKSAPPAYAVLDMRLEDGSGLSVVETIQAARPDARIIMLTGYGNIASAVAAVKAGAVDYLPKPADADDVLRALLARDDIPSPPDNPMSADRVRWEHIQRVYELCGHNVSETARRLNMHRRTLQRILAKRAPR